MKKFTSIADIRCVTVLIAAELLGISTGLCYKLVHNGQIPSVRLGRRILIPLATLHEMLDGKRKKVELCPDVSERPRTATALSTNVQMGAGEHPSG